MIVPDGKLKGCLVYHEAIEGLLVSYLERSEALVAGLENVDVLDKSIKDSLGSIAFEYVGFNEANDKWRTQIKQLLTQYKSEV